MPNRSRLNTIAKNHNHCNINDLQYNRIYPIKYYRPSYQEQNRINDFQRYLHRKKFPRIDYPETKHKQIRKNGRKDNSPNTHKTNENIIHD